MSNPFDPALYWQAGRAGVLIKCQVVPREGKNGNDVDESRQGRICVYPGNWPAGHEKNALLAEVMTGPKGPFGEANHCEYLDGMMVSCTMMPDGTPLIHNCYAAWSGDETPGAGEATGDPSYVGAPKEEGK